MKSAIRLRFFVGPLLILVLFTAYALAMAKISSTSAKDRFFKTQRILARAQASNIQTFFEDFGTSVRILAQSPSVKRRDTATVEKMDTWVGEWADAGLVRGVVLTDARGIVRFNSNVLGTRDVGVSLADRDYFIWGRERENDGEYMVGSPVISRLGASKGKRIFVVASPVFTNDVFAGVIAASVELKALTERYVNLMKISDQSIYVISGGGDLLYGTADTEEETILMDASRDILNTSTEGSIETRRYMVSYAPIDLGSQEWWLVVVSPTSEMTKIVKAIYLRQMTLLPIALVSLLVVWLLAAQKRLW